MLSGIVRELKLSLIFSLLSNKNISDT